jgi:hypothetical protein
VVDFTIISVAMATVQEEAAPVPQNNGCACNTAISKCSLEISARFATTRGPKSVCRIVNEGQEHPKLELSGEVLMERGRN